MFYQSIFNTKQPIGILVISSYPR